MTDQAKELLEYLTQIVPAATIDCDGCGAKREASKAVIRESKFYCKEECADRANALYRKPQPKSVLYDNWEV